MKITKIMDIISKSLNNHIAEGRSAGISKESMSIKIKDKSGKNYLITVKEI